MRLRDGSRPEIPVREVEVPPIPREDLPGLPGLERQRERLAVPLAMLHRRDAVAQADVHRAAQRQAGHESPAADAVEHGVLFGDTERRIGGGDRKSTRLNSSHGYISYAVFCLKKKKQTKQI